MGEDFEHFAVFWLDAWQGRSVAGLVLPDAYAGGHVDNPVALRRVIVQVVHLSRVVVEVVQFALVSRANVQLPAVGA